jgi:hypothetical protein
MTCTRAGQLQHAGGPGGPRVYTYFELAMEAVGVEIELTRLVYIQRATLNVRLHNKAELNSAKGKEILVYCVLPSNWCFTQFLNIFSANKFAILCSVDLLYYVYYFELLEVFCDRGSQILSSRAAFLPALT